MHWTKACFLILASACASVAQDASQDPLVGDPIVVSVSEKALPVSAVSATVTVLTRSEIENSHARNTTGFPDNGGGPLYSLSREMGNRKYEEFVGFPNPGITVAGGVTAHLTK